MSNLDERQKVIVSEFSNLDNWEDRYKRIIEIGKKLSHFETEHKIESNLVKGCQSQVWLVTSITKDKKIIFKGESDSLIVKGLIALLIRVYSDATAQEILETEPWFFKNLGFNTNLSPSRANGLFSMIKQIKYYAAAYASVT